MLARMLCRQAKSAVLDSGEPVRLSHAIVTSPPCKCELVDGIAISFVAFIAEKVPGNEWTEEGAGTIKEEKCLEK